jgi:phosphatidylserine decarboxylase
MMEQLRVARPGNLLLGVLLLLAVVTHLGRGLDAAALLYVLAALCFLWFRDPERHVPSAPLGVVSPVDGRVESIELAHDPFLDREALCLRLKVRWLGAYSLRAPIEGRIVELHGLPPGAGAGYALNLKTDEGNELELVMTARRLRRRGPVIMIGRRLGQGQHWGSARPLRRVALLLEPSVRLKVEPGDRVMAGTDVLALLSSPPNGRTSGEREAE